MNLKTFHQVKETRHKIQHVVRFHLCEISRKAKLQRQKADERLSEVGGGNGNQLQRGRDEVTVRGDRNVLKLGCADPGTLYKLTENRWSAYLQCVNCIVCKLYLNKTK